MFYIKPSYKALNKGKLCAFSLMEVMLTVAIISILIIILAPLMTQRTSGKIKNNGVVYTYEKNNLNVPSGSTNNKCYVTYTGYRDEDGKRLSSANVQRRYVPTIECTEYEFTVPSGVKELDLTLVAGGGGGGGAAGGTIEDVYIKDSGINLYTVGTVDSTADGGHLPKFYQEEVRGFKIDYMVGAGEGGSYTLTGNLSAQNTCKSNKNCVYSKGGASSAAIRNYDIPREYLAPFDDYRNPLAKPHELNFAVPTNLKSNISKDAKKILFAYRRSNNIHEIVPYLVYSVGYPFNTGSEYSFPPAAGNVYQHEVACCFTEPAPPFADSDVYENNTCLQKWWQLSEGSSTPGFPWPYINDFGTNKPNEHNQYYVPENEACYKRLKKENILHSVAGQKKYWDGTLGYHEGASGGRLPMYSQMGAGSNAPGMKCTEVDGCSLADKTNYEVYDGSQKLQSYLYVEHPGGIGGGGAGGSMARITKFPVKPGEKYIIRVGKGGDRGTNGTMGTEKYSFGDDSGPSVSYANFDLPINQTLSSAGSDGEGGVSSSIWRVNSDNTETLVLLVTGGAGGEGGQTYRSVHQLTEDNEAASFYNSNTNPAKIVYDGARTPYTKNLDSNNAYLEEPTNIENTLYNNSDKNVFHYQYDKGRAGSHAAMAIFNSSLDIKKYFDTEIATPGSEFGSLKPYGINTGTWTGIHIGYPLFNNLAQYKYLNNNGVLESNDVYNRYLMMDPDSGGKGYNLFGYDHFRFTPKENNNAANGEDSSNIVHVKDESRDIDTDFLTPFYYRTLVKDGIGYVGGLGGFTGLGGKAGCGGLFVGNPNGFHGTYYNNKIPLYTREYHQGDDYTAEGARQLILPQTYDGENPAADSYQLYDVSSYYDNCTSDTPDGQSADFIMPNPNPRRLSFGQAGAGGGGGGYTMFVGPGSGGNGQNGYVMINWRK